MRNIFDQYSQPENRLTHALISALSEDRRLLRRFVGWATNLRVPQSAPLEIIEQGLPGVLAETEEDAEKRGLPDACIHQGDEWALLVESKVAANLSPEQLRRHLRTADRRGLKRVKLLVLDTEYPSRPLPNEVVVLRWSDVYTWLVRESAKSEWARKVADYFVVAENRLVEEGYLKEGTLTIFSGIPFGDDEPYSYPEAKRLLRLMMEGLRTRKDLVRDLRMDPKGQGRSAITGKNGVAVWDFLRLRNSSDKDAFTHNPHLTLVVSHDRVTAMITVPNGIKSAYRRNLVDLGAEGFSELLADITKRLVRGLRGANGAVPWVQVVQRRYRSQRSAALTDARLEFDLRTAFQQKREKSKVRVQPQWLDATYMALARKRSNLQLMVGTSFPYAQCEATRDHKFTDYVARSWLACRPLIDTLLKR